jgi:hypothetical protein
MARRRNGRLAPAVAAVVGVALACGGASHTPSDGAGATSCAARRTSPTRSVTAWTLTETGWGPIRAGMSVADARAALGAAVPEPNNRECDHVRPPAGPAGVLLMVVDGQVARVEVTDTTVATAAGARVGDPEARVRALYPGRVQTTPHKYVDGHYLVVRRGPGADSLYALVFETDGRRVTRFRGGRFPEVGWVEGCS